MRHHEWGLLIVVYLFCGGLSAGAIVISALATLVDRRRRFDRLATVSAVWAPLPIIAGTGLLVLDLGRPFFFWKLFTAVRPLSPMWIGSWLIALFSILSLAYAYLFVQRPARWWSPSHPERWKRRLAIACLPLGIAVAIYTGVLLGVVVARPLWNTPLVAQLFVLSALSTASAFLMFLVDGEERTALLGVDLVLIGCEIATLVAFLIYGAVSGASAREAVRLMTATWYGVLFWIGVVIAGLVTPLVLELRHFGYGASPARHAQPSHAVAAALVLAGGFLLRLVFVYAGQASRLVS
jgi:protein NrfD